MRMVEIITSPVVDDEVANRHLFQGTVEEGLVSLQARLSNLEGTMDCLPQDSIESMLSSLTVSRPRQKK